MRAPLHSMITGLRASWMSLPTPTNGMPICFEISIVSNSPSAPKCMQWLLANDMTSNPAALTSGTKFGLLLCAPCAVNDGVPLREKTGLELAKHNVRFMEHAFYVF